MRFFGVVDGDLEKGKGVTYGGMLFMWFFFFWRGRFCGWVGARKRMRAIGGMVLVEWMGGDFLRVGWCVGDVSRVYEYASWELFVIGGMAGSLMGCVFCFDLVDFCFAC